jgi:predicted dehydrogenase
MEQSQDGQNVTRRTFLRNAGVATAAATAASWAKSPVFAVAPSRVIGANDRINLGHVGVGRHATGRGLSHLVKFKGNADAWNCQSVALSDIYEGYVSNARKQVTFSDGKVYHDYRKLLADKDVDAVIIATPEHWHAVMGIEAMEAGKDVYLEKPMTRYAEEALEVLKVQRNTKRILQVGSQGCSDPKWSRMGEMIKAGKIGKVLWAQGSYCRNNPAGEWNYDIDKTANPQNLDWNAFLGKAPKRPFDAERFFRWRKYWDYSAGIVSDLFPHRFHPLMKAMGLAWPTRVVSAGGLYVHDKKDRDVPDVVHVLADFMGENGPFTIFLAGSTVNEQGVPDVIRGNKASLYVGGSTIELRPERPYADEIEGSKENIGGEADEPHLKNFLDCVRSRETPNCNAELAARVQVTVSLAERAYRENKAMLFDPQALKIYTEGSSSSPTPAPGGASAKPGGASGKPSGTPAKAGAASAKPGGK